MANLNDIVKFLDKYLKTNEIEDDSWNGLQVEGKSDIKKIALCVSAGVDVFKKAKKENPDMIIVHHGIFWKKANPSFRGWYKKRVGELLDNGISLYASHLPLDRHPKIGNNARLLDLLGAKIKDPMSEKSGQNIGWIGESRPLSLDKIVGIIEKILNTKCTLLDYGKKEVKRIGVVSGGAPFGVFEAIEKEVDLYITGDPSDLTEIVKDAEINVIFAGHYATETLGVKALGKVLEERFRTKTVFVDSPTGL